MTRRRHPGQGPPPARLTALLVGLVLVLTGCGGARGGAGTPSEPDVLRVGLIPNIAPEEQRARYQPFADHLEAALDMEVELVVASSYAGVVTALASDRIDIAYLGGLTYVQAERQAALDPLVTEIDRDTGTSRYESAIVVRDEAPDRSVAQVLDGGGTFAMGDVASTSGSLYPRLMLEEAGAACSSADLSACPPLEEVVFTGGHDAAAQAVLQGGADAAGLELRILHRLERDGVVPPGALRVVATAEVEGYPWVARAALPEDLRARIVDAFLAIDDPALLDLLRAQSYVAVSAEDYDEIRTEAVRLGLVEG